MTSPEIEQRLRERRFPGKWSDTVVVDPLCIEAADALAEMRKALDDLLTGKQAVLPRTRKHAEDLYAVAVGCLRGCGVDVEADRRAAESALAVAREALEREREECATLAETLGVSPEHWLDRMEWHRHAKHIAAAIRA